MLFDEYESQGLLYNVNFKEVLSSPELVAYRGDLVLVPGEVADEQGRRKPPQSVISGAVGLAEGDRMKMLVGSLDDVADLPHLIKLYVPACTPETRLLMFVVNIDSPMSIDLDGLPLLLLPMPEGMVWTSLSEELSLDKGDFKGQTGGGKVMTVYKAFAGYQAKCPLTSLVEACASGNQAKRAIFGAV